jgi:hypothetical protein
LGAYPFKYLGILVHHRKLMNKERKHDRKLMNKDWKHAKRTLSEEVELLEKQNVICRRKACSR